MKRSALCTATAFFILFFPSPILILNAQSFIWSSIANTNNNYTSGTKICSDPSGNTYVYGLFEGNYISKIGTTSYDRNLGSNFIAKYNPAGLLQWSMQVRDIQMATIRCDNNYVYMAGKAVSQSGKIGTIPIGANFILKLNNSGQMIWLNDEDGSVCTDMDLDQSGNIYCTGYCSPNNQTGSLTFNQPSIASSAMYIVKYSSGGQLIWKNLACQHHLSTYGNKITVNKTGSEIYVVGISETGAPDSVHFVGSNIYVPVYNAYFVARYNYAGIPTAASFLHSSNKNHIEDLDSDENGNFYFGVSHLYFSPQLWKYNQQLMPVYSLTSAISGGNYDGVSPAIHDIEVLSDGSVYCAGTIYNKAWFANDTLDYGVGVSVGFISKIDPTGNYQWVKGVGPTNASICTGITTDDLGSLYITGQFSKVCSFDNNVISISESDMFVAKLNDPNSTTDLRTNNFTNTIVIYPNPSSGKFSVSVPEESHLKIYDITGKIKLTQNLTAEKHTMDLALTPGIYFASITSQSLTYTEKIIIY